MVKRDLSGAFSDGYRLKVSFWRLVWEFIKDAFR